MDGPSHVRGMHTWLGRQRGCGAQARQRQRTWPHQESSGPGTSDNWTIRPPVRCNCTQLPSPPPGLARREGTTAPRVGGVVPKQAICHGPRPRPVRYQLCQTARRVSIKGVRGWEIVCSEERNGTNPFEDPILRQERLAEYVHYMAQATPGMAVAAVCCSWQRSAGAIRRHLPLLCAMQPSKRRQCRKRSQTRWLSLSRPAKHPVLTHPSSTPRWARHWLLHPCHPCPGPSLPGKHTSDHPRQPSTIPL